MVKIPLLKKLLLVAICPLFMGACALYGQNEKARVFVLTDVSNEPDDEQSLVRFLVYSNEYDVEGIAASTSCFLKRGPREDIIRRFVSAYAQVYPCLRVHAELFPSPEYLQSIVYCGQKGYGLKSIGKGHESPGAKALLKAMTSPDPRPLWVCAWGGTNTLAQALIMAREQLPHSRLRQAVSKMRVYATADQDDSGLWLRKEFPELYYVSDPTPQDFRQYYRGTWTGISGDRNYNNGVYYHFDMVDNPWLRSNVIEGHGALGALYPELIYIMEGDTPTFLGLIRNGLCWSPENGGWGGRYELYTPQGETRPLYTSTVGSCDKFEYAPGDTTVSNQITIARWREDFQNDFAARMDWCTAKEYSQANHNPVAVACGKTGKDEVRINTKEDSLELSLEGSYDPDGDKFSGEWFIYPEAGTSRGAVLRGSVLDLSEATRGTTHVILRLRDERGLVAYRRIIVLKK